MIYLIHGENSAAINRRLFSLQQKFLSQGYKPQKLAAKELSGETWRTFCSQQSLFGSQKNFLLIRNCQLLSIKIWQEIIDSCQKQKKAVLFYSYQHLRSKRILSLLPSQNIFTFKPPVSIFKMLETVGQANINVSLKQLNYLSNKMPIQLILYWLKKHFRDLYWLSQQQFFGGAAWQVAKLRHQAKKLGSQRIKKFYQQLLWLDFQQRQGRLAEGLELALVNLLLKDYYEENG